jgi:putative sterol carrier protein
VNTRIHAAGAAHTMDAINFSTLPFTPMDMQAITAALRDKVGDSSGLNATLKFDCGDDGVVIIDGKSTPNTVDNTNRDTDCTVAITRENLAALISGELEPTTGFMMGKFKVSGDMSVALKLQRVV